MNLFPWIGGSVSVVGNDTGSFNSLLAVIDLSRFWEDLLTLIIQDNVFPISVALYTFSLLLWLALPQERANIRRSFWMFNFSLAVLVASVAFSVLKLVPVAGPVYWAGLMLGGVAMVNLCAMAIFDILLRPIAPSIPRIARDLLVAAGYFAVGLALLSRAGLSLSGLITTSAILTAVIGFSMQDTFGNVMGGLALQTDKSIKVGDWIKVDQSVGRVTEIRWRHTAIETRNWETVIIPNSVLMKAQVVVLGRRTDKPTQLRRWVLFNVDFRVSPTEVIKTAGEVFNSDNLPGVAADPHPDCILYEIKESYCVYAVRYWLTDIANDDPTDSMVRTRIYFALKRVGIPLSIPAQSVFVTEESQMRKEQKQVQDLEHRLQALKHVVLFNQLQDAELRHLAERLRPAPFARGEIMTRQGAEAHWLYLITKGSAEVDIAVEGLPRRAVALLREGDFFGEMSLMTGARRSATVIALEDVECYRLDKEAFQEILQRRPEVAEQISLALAKRHVELEAAREGLDAEVKQSRMKSAQSDILGRIRSFFSLNNHAGNG